jgi:hypothetical protein
MQFDPREGATFYFSLKDLAEWIVISKCLKPEYIFNSQKKNFYKFAMNCERITGSKFKLKTLKSFYHAVSFSCIIVTEAMDAQTSELS